MTQEQAIKTKINLNDYDSIKVGGYVETELGDFVCAMKPNLYQPIESRVWIFMQTTDADGEPFNAENTIKIKG